MESQQIQISKFNSLRIVDTTKHKNAKINLTIVQFRHLVDTLKVVTIS